VLSAKGRRLVTASVALVVIAWGTFLFIRNYPLPFLAPFMPEGWDNFSRGFSRSELYRKCGAPDIPWGDIKGDVWLHPTPLGSWRLSVYYIDGGPLVNFSYVDYYLGTSEHYVRLHVRMPAPLP